MKRRYLVPVCTLLLAVGCGGDTVPEEQPEAEAPAAEAAAMPELPAVITAERGGFIPEGVEYDMTGHRLLTGSLAEGTVFEIHGDGTITPVVEDSDLVSSVGIEVDEPRNRLLVTNSNRDVFGGEVTGHAMLGVYALDTGERLAMVDLGAAIENAPDDQAHFANDVTVNEADGTVYVTDTQASVIYHVDSTYMASVFHTFDGVGLNGIVHHPNGYLLVAGGATLYKVPVADPAGTTEVSLPEEIAGQDGLVWTSDGRLAITSNSQSRVVALSSSDDWATAELAGVAPYDGQGTTAAAVGDDVYVVQPHFNDEDPPMFVRAEFE